MNGSNALLGVLVAAPAGLVPVVVPSPDRACKGTGTAGAQRANRGMEGVRQDEEPSLNLGSG